jgi:hypothetical protein
MQNNSTSSHFTGFSQQDHLIYSQQKLGYQQELLQGTQKTPAGQIQQHPAVYVKQYPQPDYSQEPLQGIHKTPAGHIQQYPAGSLQQWPWPDIQGTPAGYIHQYPAADVTQEPRTDYSQEPLQGIQGTPAGHIQQHPAVSLQQWLLSGIQETPTGYIQQHPVTYVEQEPRSDYSQEPLVNQATTLPLATASTEVPLLSLSSVWAPEHDKYLAELFTQKLSTNATIVLFHNKYPNIKEAVIRRACHKLSEWIPEEISFLRENKDKTTLPGDFKARFPRTIWRTDDSIKRKAILVTDLSGFGPRLTSEDPFTNEHDSCITNWKQTKSWAELAHCFNESFPGYYAETETLRLRYHFLHDLEPEILNENQSKILTSIFQSLYRHEDALQYSCSKELNLSIKDAIRVISYRKAFTFRENLRLIQLYEAGNSIANICFQFKADNTRSVWRSQASIQTHLRTLICLDKREVMRAQVMKMDQFMFLLERRLEGHTMEDVSKDYLEKYPDSGHDMLGSVGRSFRRSLRNMGVARAAFLMAIVHKKIHERKISWERINWTEITEPFNSKAHCTFSPDSLKKAYLLCTIPELPWTKKHTERVQSLLEHNKSPAEILDEWHSGRS